MPAFDGDIKLTATLTPGDIKKTAQQLKTELTNTLNVGKKDQLSIPFMKAQASITKTIDKINSLQQKLATLENTKIPTPDYSEVQKMIDEAQRGLQKLSNKMYDFKMEGGDTTSEAYHRMQAQADELNETIAYGKGELQDLVETGKAFTLGSDTQQYKDLTTELNRANDALTIQKAHLEDVIQKEQAAAEKERQIAEEQARKAQQIKEQTGLYAQIDGIYGQMANRLSEMRASFDATFGNNQEPAQVRALRESINETAKYAEILRGRLDALKTMDNGNLSTHAEEYSRILAKYREAAELLGLQKSKLDELVNADKKAQKEHDKTADSAKRMAKEHNNTGLSLDKFGKGLKKGLRTILKYGLGIRSFYFLFRKIRNAIKEGFTNLANVDAPLKTAINNFKASAAALKNSIAAAFSPIAEAIIPVVTRLVQLLVEAFNKLAQFNAALMGKDTVKVASTNFEDYANAIGDSTDALKENAKAQSYLTGLDEVRKNTDTGTGGGTLAGATGFQDVAIGSDTLEAAEKFKKKLENLKEALSPFAESMAKIKEDTLKWLQETDFGPLEDSLDNLTMNGVIPFVNALGGFFEKTYSTIILPAMTYLVEQILPPINDFFTRTLQQLTEFINKTTEWLDKIDFTALKEQFDKMGGKGGTFDQFLNGLSAIGDVLLWLYEDIILPVAQWLIENILPTIIGFFNDLFGGFGDLFTGIRDIIAGFREGDMQQIMTGLGEFIKGLWKILFAPIKMIALQIWAVLKQLWQWITDGVKAIWEKITAWFGKLKEGYWAFWKGVWKFITDTWDKIKQFFSKIKDRITAKIDEWFPGWRQLIAAILAEAWRKLKEWVKKIWTAAWTWITGVFGKIKDWVVGWISKRIEWWKSRFSAAKKLISAVLTWTRDAVKKGFTKIKDVIKPIMEKIKNVIKTPINVLIGFFNKFLNGLIGGLNALISRINSIRIDVPEWAQKLSGVSYLGFNLPLLDVPQIPLLAQGAVIPANREFLAVLGDQKNGNNIEAPENLLRQIVREESGSRNNVYNVTATANRKVLFEMIIDEGKSRQQMTGRNPFAFA